MEKCLHYVGIDNFTVLQPNVGGDWRNVFKLVELRKYIYSNSCNYEYILFCDSDDAVLRDDPGKAIEYLHEHDCEMLLSRTKAVQGYECIPKVKMWADEIADRHGYNGYYINSGVYVARVSFLQEVLDAAMEYITGHDLSTEEYRRLRSNGLLCKRLSEYPTGIGSCQVILRYLHPTFYPDMKVDSQGSLALRDISF